MSFRFSMLTSAILLLAALGHAWTSPGFGVVYTPESLVSISAGALEGEWPDFIQHEDIQISSGDALRLPAGVIWSVDAGYELRIAGRIEALGSPWDQVNLRGTDESPGSWSGLILDDAEASSLLRCVTIQHGEDGLNCLGSSPTVEYCEFSSNLDSGMHCFLEAHPQLKHCLIQDNQRYGVVVTGGCSPVLKHCVIRNNNIANSSPLNAFSIGIQDSNSPRLVSCLLEGRGPANQASGFSLWMSGHPEVLACEIAHFRSGLVIQGAGAFGQISDNWIHDNHYTNPMLGGSGININTGAAPVFRGNCIEGNDWGVTVTSACTPDFGTMQLPGNNRLHDNGNGATIMDYFNNTSTNLEARGNWWGSTDPTLIADHINDADDGAYGSVHVEPIREDSLFAPHLSPDLGYIALERGEGWCFNPAEHFRQTPGLVFTLDGPGEAEYFEDEICWSDPASSDSLLTLLLYAETMTGQSTCDTMRVWLPAMEHSIPELSIRILGADAQLSWTPVGGAVSYRLEKSVSPDFMEVELCYEGSMTDAVDEHALHAGLAFYRVVALHPGN